MIVGVVVIDAIDVAASPSLMLLLASSFTDVVVSVVVFDVVFGIASSLLSAASLISASSASLASLMAEELVAVVAEAVAVVVAGRRWYKSETI